MDVKTIRKEIRKCKTGRDIYLLFKSLEEKGIKLQVRRRGRFEPADTRSADYHVFEDGYVTCYLPPAWSCSFRSIKILSYNIKISPDVVISN